ncbi:MAG TPA: hypothetical protein VFQ38_23410 [Longimicrobiales bacterium]|nr:hypothetical protein [Longimicrobiales bacterium]
MTLSLEPIDDLSRDPAAGGFSRCLFCRGALPAPEPGGRLPPGRRFAFDPERGRVWVVCGTCARWNLLPLDSRAEVLDELQRRVRDEGRLLVRTAHVALLDAGLLHLVRVGPAGLAEEAWWRYGQRLVRRRQGLQHPGARLGADLLSAVTRLGERVGLVDPVPALLRSDVPLEDIVRRLRFGQEAWNGRVRCRFCGSVLRAIEFEDSWWLYPFVAEDGALGVGVPCPRCDPWTPEHVFRLAGPTAELLLRRVLAYQHVAGASERLILDAAGQIEAAGSAERFARHVSSGRESLWRLGPLRTVALEIALNDDAERRALNGAARTAEVVWRQEEELAAIADTELDAREAP